MCFDALEGLVAPSCTVIKVLGSHLGWFYIRLKSLNIVRGIERLHKA